MNNNMLPTMTPEEREEYMEMIAEESALPIAKLDGFDDCLLYYTEDGDTYRAVYCYEDLVESFVRNNNTSFMDAVEFVDYNVMRSLPYMGMVGGKPSSIPIIIHRINRSFTTLDESYFKEND